MSSNGQLVGVIAEPRGIRVSGNTFRRYGASMMTDATINGLPDPRATAIVYEVGCGVKSADSGLSVPAKSAPTGINADYPTGFILSEGFLSAAKKYSNFSASFDFTSLAGIVERLGRGLAAWTFFEGVDSDSLAGGLPINVSALGSHAAPINSLAASVFIPRLATTAYSPDAFGVIVAAAAGEGARIVTDVLAIDARGFAVVPTCGHEGFPLAVVDALRILGANMVSAGQGPLFALALTRGLHKVATVVGHTDEGGITRELLRAGSFTTPFGGIHYGMSAYSGLPALASTSVPSVCAYVDSLVLTTAAAVAHADPGIVVDNVWYPTTLDISSSPDVHPSGTNIAPSGDELLGRGLAAYLRSLPTFAEPFIDCLGKLFAAPGSSYEASRALIAMGAGIPAQSRHLNMHTIAPFFWIEPTSLLSPNQFGTVAEREGAGSLCGREHRVTKPAFPFIEKVTDTGLSYTDCHLEFKGARYLPFLHHWSGHPLNGLGAVSVKQLDPNSILLPGPCKDSPKIADRVLKGLPLSEFLWKRGQSPFPAPAEMLNTSGMIGVGFRHATIDDLGVPTLEHLPRQHELESCTITYTASRLQGLSNGSSNFGAPGVARSRTIASRELAAVKLRADLHGVTGGRSMGISLTAPSRRTRIAAPDIVSSSAGSGSVKTSEGHTAHSTDELDTERVPTVQLAGSTIGPRPPTIVPRVLGVGVGGPTPSAGALTDPTTPPRADPAVEPVPAQRVPTDSVGTLS